MYRREIHTVLVCLLRNILNVFYLLHDLFVNLLRRTLSPTRFPHTRTQQRIHGLADAILIAYISLSKRADRPLAIERESDRGPL